MSKNFVLKNTKILSQKFRVKNTKFLCQKFRVKNYFEAEIRIFYRTILTAYKIWMRNISSSIEIPIEIRMSNFIAQCFFTNLAKINNKNFLNIRKANFSRQK